MSNTRRNLAIWAAAVVWAAGIAYGSLTMWQFQRKAGEGASAPTRWPASTRLTLAKNAPTVVLSLILAARAPARPSPSCASS
jgi:hypothetical protein